MDCLQKAKSDHEFVKECIVRYKNIPLNNIGNKDWTQAIPLYYDIQKRVGIRNLNKFIAYLENIEKQEKLNYKKGE